MISIAIPPMPNASVESEIRIARDAGEYLDPAGDEFLHQESGVGRSRLEPVEPLAARPCKGAREVVVAREADGDQAELGLVRNVVRDAP